MTTNNIQNEYDKSKIEYEKKLNDKFQYKLDRANELFSIIKDYNYNIDKLKILYKNGMGKDLFIIYYIYSMIKYWEKENSNYFESSKKISEILGLDYLNVAKKTFSKIEEEGYVHRCGHTGQHKRSWKIGPRECCKCFKDANRKVPKDAHTIKFNPKKIESLYSEIRVSSEPLKRFKELTYCSIDSDIQTCSDLYSFKNKYFDLLDTCGFSYHSYNDEHNIILLRLQGSNIKEDDFYRWANIEIDKYIISLIYDAHKTIEFLFDSNEIEIKKIYPINLIDKYNTELNKKAGFFKPALKEGESNDH